MGNQVWKILMIDDDEDDYILTRSMLSEAHGAKVALHWSGSWQEGREELRSDRYDAALVDYDLGAVNGLELTREAVDSGFSAPIILLTGRGTPEVDEEAMQAGATMYLTKGEANPLLLERVIRYAMEIKEKEVALRRQAERMELLVEISREILTAGPDRAALTAMIFEKVRGHLNADVAFNYALAYPAGPLNLVIGFGIPEDMREAAQQLQLGQAFCGTVAATGRPLAAGAERILTDEKGQFVREMGVRAYACHPLFSREGRLLGTLSLASTRRSSFTPEEIAFMQTVCHFVALAWESR